MKIKIFIGFILLTVVTTAHASPKFLVKHHRNARNLAEIQIINQSIDKLICYVAIDGHKIYFRLPARQPSKWYVATDEGFNHANFSTWCDYLSLHPKYQKN
ncbi:hypothetical protein [Candidatus Colwellia aromaticivorans]|uniref:hypothetical protein n=1 Tax=Candidatus Colwellia aromaticivorans TaxID=2267621 RepID=UPI000DF14106|nr:hypothetical protein [Candidatus Colwellia aromaticivorans]